VGSQREPVRIVETREEVRPMAWETPEFVEVRMDAEVTAYQGDLGE
jgi:coenzyme PQQ precursor peptide PqqA